MFCANEASCYIIETYCSTISVRQMVASDC